MQRGRFAPTPSGLLHMGSLVAALASYLDVRSRGGEWLVRIEDVDTTRSRPQFEKAILKELERHHLFWDGAVIRQSDRGAEYTRALEQLFASGHLYSCFCSRQKLKIRGCRLNAQGEVIYPGFCRPVQSQSHSELNLNGNSALRFLVQDDHFSFVDVLAGTQEGHVLDDSGDFVVRRADGCFTYHLAVVVDDYLQGVTRVVRGADILPQTGRHILLQRALGYPKPVYAHVPLVLGDSGEKLSKSTSARALAESDALDNLLTAFSYLKIKSNKSDFSSAKDALNYAVANYRLT